MLKLKNYFVLLLAVIIILASIPSCRKWFDDGPRFSLRSIKNRLQGTWEFLYISVNGVDSTNVFRQRIGCYLDLKSMVKTDDFSKDGACAPSRRWRD